MRPRNTISISYNHVVKYDPLAVRRFLRYTTVGVATFLFDLALLYVAVSILSIPYYIATPIAFLIAVSVNYAISRSLVFHGTQRSWQGGYVYFAAVAAGGALATTGLVAALVSGLGMYYLFARVFVAGIVGMANYLFNLYLNFKVVGIHGDQ